MRFLLERSKKWAARRSPLPKIDWNDQHQVSALTGKQLKLNCTLSSNIFKSVEERALVVLILRYVRASHDPPKIEGNDANDSERQSSDSQDDWEDDSQSNSSEMDDSVERSFEVLFHAQRSKNVTVQKGWIHVNVSWGDGAGHNFIVSD